MSTDTHKALARAAPEPIITLAQAGRALLFVVLYVAAVILAFVGAGVVGLIDFTAEVMLPLILGGATVSILVSIYLHLVRRNSLTMADLGFRRPTRRMFHLLWQVPAVFVVSILIQGLFLALLTHFGMDTSSADSKNSSLAGIVNLSAPMVVVCVVAITVLTPIWEEVMFRGAFLDGFTMKFGAIAAIFLSAGLFAAVHMLPISFLYLFVVGIALALLRRFHGNIWAPIILHAANNGLATAVIFMAI